MSPVDPGTWGPAPAVDLLAYPGRSPEHSWIHTEAGVLPVDEDRLDDALARLGVAPRRERVAVLCSGSNANPAQVVRKLAPVDGDRTVPHLRVPIRGAGAVYSAHVARYGAIPATFDRLPGVVGQVHIAWYTRTQLDAVEVSEAGAYDLLALDDPAVDLPLDEPVHAWLSHAGTLQLDGAPVPLGDQRALLRRLLDDLEPEHYARAPEAHRQELRSGLQGAPHRLRTRDPVLPWP